MIYRKSLELIISYDCLFFIFTQILFKFLKCIFHGSLFIYVSPPFKTNISNKNLRKTRTFPTANRQETREKHAGISEVPQEFYYTRKQY